MADENRSDVAAVCFASAAALRSPGYIAEIQRSAEQTLRKMQSLDLEES